MSSTLPNRLGRRIRVAAVLAAGALIAGGSMAAAPNADWNRFRGPNGSGVVAGASTPASFTEKDFNWRVELPGAGHSSPAIVGDKIFLTCGDASTGKRSLVCLSLETGRQLWAKDYDVPKYGMHKDNSLASVTPSADDQRVVFSFCTTSAYKVFCVDHSGNELWSYDLGPWKGEHGQGASPILYKDVVIVPNDQDGPTASLVGLDAKTGQPRWKLERHPAKAAYSTPCLFQPKDGPAQVILNSSGDGLTSVDPLTGKVNWAIPDAMKFRSVASAFATDTVCGGTCGEGGANRGGIVVQPDPANPTAPPKVLHKLPTGNAYSYVPTPVILGDLMFLWADTGTVTCVKTMTGEKVWQQKIPPAAGARIEFYASPIVVGDKLYNVSKDGEVICLKAADKFELLGRSALSEKCHATIAVAGNRLIIRTLSHLVSVGK